MAADRYGIVYTYMPLLLAASLLLLHSHSWEAECIAQPAQTEIAGMLCYVAGNRGVWQLWTCLPWG